MIWQPYLLAVVFGVAVSAAIYAAFLWPRVEPEDDDGDDDGDADADGDRTAGGDRRGTGDPGDGGDAVRATD